jgi:hypothetical protein
MAGHCANAHGRNLCPPPDSTRSLMRYGCIGHRVYFENHFIEGHADSPDIRGFDYDHSSSRPFSQLLAFGPDVSLIYRPELYSTAMLRMLPGLKIGFSSEPLPTGAGARRTTSSETDLREQVYRGLVARGYDMFFHYDAASAGWFDERGVHVDGYRPLPIDCDVFNPHGDADKDIDFLFVGKATPHRIAVLDRFRWLPFRFVWIAHGVSGRALADVIRRSRCLINVHADAREQFEPRVQIAALCGVAVLSEPLGTSDFAGREVVHQTSIDRLSVEELTLVLELSKAARDLIADQWPTVRAQLSTRVFVQQCVRRHLDGQC